MSDIIHLLPDSVANQIAAGEVIQRPASVIKELVENSVDAGATRIDIIVTDAGKTCIQVIDNGKGMSDTDARLSFERHATSKIQKAEDLFALRTMGFRGEALASIAAVAQVELKTKTADEEIGTIVTIEGSQIKKQEAAACATGAVFTVKNLFFNVPARRRFLKSDQTELNNIIAEFEHIALVHPDIAFTLKNNDNDIFNLQPAPLKKRIMDVCGKKVNSWLLPVKVTTTLVNIHGFISKPEFARKKAMQYMFVNDRYMRHPYFNKAIAEAYDKLIPQGLQIPYFIYFDVDPANIDVNIHPTKTEIKFENEQYIWQIIISAIKESLGTFNAIPAIDFDTEGMPDIPAFGSAKDVQAPESGIDTSYNPFSQPAPQHSSGNVYRSKIRQNTADWQKLYNDEARSATEESIATSWMNDINLSPSLPETDESWTLPEASTAAADTGEQQQPEYEETQVHSALNSRQQHLFESADLSQQTEFIQTAGKYIVTNVKSGLMLIDQHRAHLKILYDRYLRQIGCSESASQQVLFPHIIQLTPAESMTLDSIMDDMQSAGFDISNLGGGSYAINGVPTGIKNDNHAELVTEIVQSAMEFGKDFRQEIRSGIALSLASSAAIPYGRQLSEKEATEIISQLLSSDMPEYTPDGKKIIYTITDKELEKFFK